MSNKDQLLERFLNKEATAEELLELYHILNEENDPFAEKVAEELQNLQDIPDDVNAKVQRLFNEVFAEKIGLGQDEPEIIPIHRSNRNYWRGAAAAIVIFAIGGAIYNYGIRETKAPLDQIASNKSAKDRFVSVAGKQFVVLPDSSTVLLNEGSKLTYSLSYGEAERVVTLIGEGFFDVKHDPEHRFIVRSAGVTTSVLGTAFNVKAYEKDHSVIVTVARGKVSVADDRQAFGTITPNEQIAVNTANFVCVRTKVSAAVATAWADKFIIINNQRFEDAIAIVASRFKIKITLENAALKNCKVNAAFLDENQLQDVLTALTTLANASWTMKDGNVEIRGGGCE